MSTLKYPIPAGEAKTEITVANSRFIACAGPAFKVEEARTFIARTKERYPDASHHVPAYLIGYGNSVIAHCSDGGEPPGTAGKPILGVLKGSGLGDVVVVVVRYFGGTKLGTGGLVHAYSNAVREVLAVLPRVIKTPTCIASIALPYSLFERVKLLIAEYGGEIIERDFGIGIKLTSRFPAENFAGFQKALGELSHGMIRAEIVSMDQGIAPMP